MEVLPNIELIDLGILLKKEKTLIIADLHIGLEEALHKQGFLVPRFQFKDLLERLDKILEKAKPKSIIINGDLKHEFGRISQEEWDKTIKLLDHLKQYKLVLLKGNHDTILGPIAEKRSLEIKDHAAIKGIYICHGHKIPEDDDFKKAKTLIIGHEHPAITLSDEIRAEKYKCCLIGKWKRKSLIVQPSFSLLQEGTDVKKEKLLSPFLKSLNKFRACIAGDKIYCFDSIWH